LVWRVCLLWGRNEFLDISYLRFGNQNRSVTILTRLRAGRSGIRILAGAKDISLPYRLRGGGAAFSLLCHGCRRLLHRRKASGPSCRPLTSSLEVKNEWRSTSTPCVCLGGVYRDNFTFYLSRLEASRGKD
jgi:hypothetical protein